MADSMKPFLMFQGAAEAAMNLYVSLFPGAEIIEVNRYGPGEAGAEGSVKTAMFSVAGQEVMCIDSPVEHAFSFTPASSFFVNCSSEEELQKLVAGLSEEGAVLMPLADYGFSRQFAWVNDRYGVSWQLNLP
jgi:predicted 3-demethylubiquinone-9 3-methyltransferase (glyoxalase superfamily)